jgi:hypothetical protein
MVTLKRVLSYLLLSILIAGLIAVALPFVVPFLLLLLFVGGRPLVFVMVPALALAACWLVRGVLGQCGLSRGRAWSIAALCVAAAVVCVSATLFLGQPGGQAVKTGFDYAGKIGLSDMRIVRGVPGCPERCAAGTLANQGEQSVSKVHLSLEFRDAEGRPLGRVSTPVTWTPEGNLPPGGSAEFLYSPTVGLLGINPRLSRVAGEVVIAEVADSSRPRGIVHAASGWIFRHGIPARIRTKWFTPQETMEYAKQVTVTAQIESWVEDTYRVKGVVHNEGDLPLREVSVALSVVDSRGVVVAEQLVQPVQYYYNNQEGPYEPLASRSSRDFSIELHGGKPWPGPPQPPVTLEATLRSINLGPKSTVR